MILDKTAPTFGRLPYSEFFLERIAGEALGKHEGVLPVSPSAVFIEKLIEAEFGFNETYAKLDDGILGEIHFGIEDRPIKIRIARHLAEIDSSEPNIDHERRSTLAHECGHGLAHSKLFANLLRRDRAPNLPGFEDQQQYIACRDRDIFKTARPTADSSNELWLEWEANFLMEALLLPRKLVFSLLAPFLEGSANGFAPRILPTRHRSNATYLTAQVFNVSRLLAASRLTNIFPVSPHPDLFSTTADVKLLSQAPLRSRARSRRTPNRRVKT